MDPQRGSVMALAILVILVVFVLSFMFGTQLLRGRNDIPKIESSSTMQ